MPLYLICRWGHNLRACLWWLRTMLVDRRLYLSRLGWVNDASVYVQPRIFKISRWQFVPAECGKQPEHSKEVFTRNFVCTPIVARARWSVEIDNFPVVVAPKHFEHSFRLSTGNTVCKESLKNGSNTQRHEGSHHKFVIHFQTLSV